MDNLKTAIVTGGGQGIGSVIAISLFEEGYQVAVFEVDPEAGKEISEDINAPDRFLFIETDVSNEMQVIRSMEETAEKFGSIDILINNAAISRNKPLQDLSVNEWRRVIDVNLTGAFICSKYAAPYLKKAEGSIINICSTRAFMSEPNTEAYSASKGGIFSLTHALAMSLGPDVRVNSISPGWIDVTRLKKKKDRNPYQFRKIDHEQHPAGRVGNAEDIASMVLFLIDKKNSFINGQNFTIDGGMTIKMIYQ